jgi:hypothetical protein
LLEEDDDDDDDKDDGDDDDDDLLLPCNTNDNVDEGNLVVVRKKLLF